MNETTRTVRALKPCDIDEPLGSRVLVWPVEIVSLTAMPKSRIDEVLNPFEKLVLDFLRADPQLTPAQLSKEIFVPEDFVMCIYRRLQDKRLLDSSFNVYENLDKQEDKKRPIPGKAFRELATGRFLPYVLFGSQVPTQSVESNHRTYVMKAKNVPSTPVSITDIAHAFQLMQSRSQVHLNLPNIKHVRFSSTHDKGYIYCVLKFDKHDGEIRIRNPFTTNGNEFEGTLESALVEVLRSDQVLENWLLEWRRSLRVDENKEVILVKKASYDNERNRQLYPQLVAALNRNATATYESIYAVIEWALYYADTRFVGVNPRAIYSLLDWQLNKAVQQLKGQEIGIPLPLLKNLNKTNFRKYQNGNPDMITALVVSQERATVNPGHPFRLLLKSDKQFIKNILLLKQERDSSTHGSSVSRNASEDKVRWMESVLSTLLPDFHYFPGNSTTRSNAQTFDARSDMLELMGYGHFMNLSYEAQDHLVRARLALVGQDVTEDSTLLIGHLCAALEAEFRRHIQDMTIHGLSDDELFEQIYQRFEELAITPPEVLMQTKGMRFRKALQISDKTTLGACVLAWMLSTDFELLQAIVSGYPSLFSDMSKLIDLRDHLNKKTVLSKTEIQRLFNNTCRVITIINLKPVE